MARDIVYTQVRGMMHKRIERVEALRIIEKRIARAAVRLAAVLNSVIAVSTGTR